MKECVLLVEEVDGRIYFRPVILTQRVTQIVERVHVSETALMTRLWVCREDERDLTGHCRIFREVPTCPPPREPSEAPVFDELVIKKPLPLTPSDS